jgi:hypothetical protein
MAPPRLSRVSSVCTYQAAHPIDLSRLHHYARSAACAANAATSFALFLAAEKDDFHPVILRRARVADRSRGGAEVDRPRPGC